MNHSHSLQLNKGLFIRESKYLVVEQHECIPNNDKASYLLVAPGSNRALIFDGNDRTVCSTDRQTGPAFTWWTVESRDNRERGCFIVSLSLKHSG